MNHLHLDESLIQKMLFGALGDDKERETTLERETLCRESIEEGGYLLKKVIEKLKPYGVEYVTFQNFSLREIINF